MTTAPATAPAAPPAQGTRRPKLPREQDPRNPNFRLAALLDDGSLRLISEDDDSGMLAAVGTVAGTPVVAFCSDATVMGGAMGEVGCKVVVRAYERAMADGVPKQYRDRRDWGEIRAWAHQVASELVAVPS